MLVFLSRIFNKEQKMSHLQTAENFTSLMSLEDDRYAFSSIFDDSSWGKKRLSKSKFKLLKNLEPALDKILEPDEKVFFVTYGTLNKIMEQLIGGWIMLYLNKKAFLFTNKRIILVGLKGRLKPGDLKSHIDVCSIQKIKKHLLGSVSIVFNSGKKMNFVYIPRPDKKFLSQVSTQLMGEIPAEQKTNTEEVFLCPHCGKAPQVGLSKCNLCNGEFKSAQKAGLLSLLFPGLGDFYLGHKGLAILEMLGAMLVWMGVLLSVTESPGDLAGFAIVFSFLFIFMHGVDAAFTYYMGKKGLYPA